MHTTFETIGEKTIPKIESIKKMIDFPLHKSYLNFITKYGYGIIGANIDYLNIVEPDKNFFDNNFIEDIDLWDWVNNTQKNKITNSILIAHTFDGQHIYSTPGSFLILPRFEDPIEFYDFDEVILHYIKLYSMESYNITYKCHKGY